MTRGGIFSSSARSVNAGHDAFRQATDRAARADVHRDDVQQQVTVDRRRFELDVVDAHDLAAVDVDDLLIEEVALEQQDAVGRDVRSQAAASVAARTVAPPTSASPAAASARRRRS